MDEFCGQYLMLCDDDEFCGQYLMLCDDDAVVACFAGSI